MADSIEADGHAMTMGALAPATGVAGALLLPPVLAPSPQAASASGASRSAKSENVREDMKENSVVN